MGNVEVKKEIKNSDDGKGILITNDAIEQISNFHHYWWKDEYDLLVVNYLKPPLFSLV